MGCDIHAYIECDAGQYRDGAWWTDQVAGVNIPRDYVLFGLMANVRYHPEWMAGVGPVSQPRGLPERLSYITFYEYKEWEGDAHSESWLGISKLEEVLQRYEQIAPAVSIGAYRVLKAIIAMMDALAGDEPERVRLVFWFDN
uniref:Uncharacterized protein n=2 Tax=viral metagenome TaxID=1070528 RepID=A0A6M3KWN6_9ZZZZ